MSTEQNAAASAEADARILDAAAMVLLRRYGKPVGSGHATMLTELAAQVREEIPESQRNGPLVSRLDGPWENEKLPDTGPR